MLRTKIVSSLIKVYTDSVFDSLAPLKKISMLRGERISFQLVTQYVKEDGDGKFTERKLYTPHILGALAGYVTMREVRNIPVELPTLPDLADDNYERITPGLYPDLLEPLTHGGRVNARALFPSSVWVDVTVPERAEEVGEGDITIELVDEGGEVCARESITVDLIDMALPEQKLILTQWFHTDCLANYYDVEVFSEKHWQIIENFARVAVKNGINMLLTPMFTPPLDTQIGGERLTTQLVGVTVENGKYTFNFDLVDRWVEMCDRIGIKYFEISHLFTQWGAKHAPKVMATVDGEYRKIFGWETDAQADEYVTFLRQFLTELLAHMKKNGNDKRCYFHISDEPVKDQVESYCKAKSAIKDLLDGYVTMDALSDYEFFAEGIVSTPISNINSISGFIDKGIPNLWGYYCCGECSRVSNRFISMPAARNRSIGMQLYKYELEGFLQWGFNFFSNQASQDTVNPFYNVSSDSWVPAGDTLSVYPGFKGVALESMRLLVFHDAIQDLRAMQLCESLYSKEEVVGAIEDIFGKEITFYTCAREESTILNIREKINEMIKAKV